MIWFIKKVQLLKKKTVADFESAEYQDEKSDPKSPPQSEEKVGAPENSKQDDDILSSSQMLVVDPDSGEMSAAHSEVDNVKSDDTSCQLQDNSVPSPASTVEIVISSVGMHRLVAQASGKSIIIFFKLWNI